MKPPIHYKMRRYKIGVNGTSTFGYLIMVFAMAIQGIFGHFEGNLFLALIGFALMISNLEIHEVIDK